MRSMTDVEAIQWLFECEKIIEEFNWPVSAAGLAAAKRGLDAAVASKASAEEVLAAYEKFSAAIGPTVMTTLLQSDDAFPEVNHSSKPTPPSSGMLTLYVAADGRRVLAECTTQWGMPPKFSVS